MANRNVNRSGLIYGLCLAAIFLTACGGGGSSGSNTTVDATTLTADTFSKSALEPTAANVASSLGTVFVGQSATGAAGGITSKDANPKFLMKRLFNQPALRHELVTGVLARPLMALGILKPNGRTLGGTQKRWVNLATQDISSSACPDGGTASAETPSSGSSTELSGTYTVTAEGCKADDGSIIDGTLTLNVDTNATINQQTGELENQDNLQATVVFDFGDFTATEDGRESTLDGKFTVNIENVFDDANNDLTSTGSIEFENFVVQNGDENVVSSDDTTLVDTVIGMKFSGSTDDQGVPNCEEAELIGVFENRATGAYMQSPELPVVSYALLLDETNLDESCAYNSSSATNEAIFSSVNDEIDPDQFLVFEIDPNGEGGVTLSVYDTSGAKKTVTITANEDGTCTVAIEGSSETSTVDACDEYIELDQFLS